MKRLGVSFKGGAARGFGAIGVVKFLEEEGIKPSVLAGASAGAILASMVSLGYSSDEILGIIRGVKFKRLAALTSFMRYRSFVPPQTYKRMFLSVHKDVNIEDLPTKLIVFATDPVTHQREFITKGSLIEALLASSGFPIFLPEIRREGRRLIDGDLTPSFSPSKLKEYGCDVVLGVGHKRRIPQESEDHGVFGKANEVIDILHNQVSILNDNIDPPDIKLLYDASNYSFVDFANLEILINRAYKAARRQKGQIYEALNPQFSIKNYFLSSFGKIFPKKNP